MIYVIGKPTHKVIAGKLNIDHEMHLHIINVTCYTCMSYVKNKLIKNEITKNVTYLVASVNS